MASQQVDKLKNHVASPYQFKICKWGYFTNNPGTYSVRQLVTMETGLTTAEPRTKREFTLRTTLSHSIALLPPCVDRGSIHTYCNGRIAQENYPQWREQHNKRSVQQYKQPRSCTDPRIPTVLAVTNVQFTQLTARTASLTLLLTVRTRVPISTNSESLGGAGLYDKN
jgi:hypothetical protein